jgi:hypothetical protein
MSLTGTARGAAHNQSGSPRGRPCRRSGLALVGRASFPELKGLVMLPPEVAARVGCDIVVADTANPQVKGIHLADRRFLTLARTGRRLGEHSGAGPTLTQDLSTPWDVVWFIDRVVIA